MPFDRFQTAFGFRIRCFGAQFGRLLLLFPWILLGAACQTFTLPDELLGSAKATSVHSWSSSKSMPQDIRRLAVLQTSATFTGSNAKLGIKHTSHALISSLAASSSFEIVEISSDQLLRWTGKPAWASTDALSTNLLNSILLSSGCDAIMFSDLLEYRPYPPQALASRLKLVSGSDGKIEWTADDRFDAGNVKTANAARRFYLAALNPQDVTRNSRSILDSPERFARFAADSIVASIPPRIINRKNNP